MSMWYANFHRRLILCAQCALVLLVCVGCAPSAVTDVLAPIAPAVRLTPFVGTIGQSFVARHAGLQQVVFLAVTDGGGDGRLTLRLRDSALSSVPDVRTAQIIVRAPLAPAALTLSSLPGSNVPLNANITLKNVSPVGANYTVSYSTRVSGPTAGAIGPNTTVNLPIVINPAGLAVGTYNLSVTINADNTDNGVQSLPITLTVGPQVKLFLPYVIR